MVEFYDSPLSPLIIIPSYAGSITMLKVVEIEKCSKILEVGCGPALVAPFVVDTKSKECVYYATDYSEGMLSIAIKNIHNKFYPSKLPSAYTEPIFYEDLNLHLQKQDA